MDTNIIYNIDKMMQELEYCRKNKLYYAALTMALTLPDICSQLDRNIKGDDGEKYIQWVDKWMQISFIDIAPKICLISKDSKGKEHINTKGSWGQIIYKLRCSLLHDGKNNIINKEYFTFNMSEFNLFYNDDEDFYLRPLQISSTHDININEADLNQQEKIIIDLNIDYLIHRIWCSVMDFAKDKNIGKDIFPRLIIEHKQMTY